MFVSDSFILVLFAVPLTKSVTMIIVFSGCSGFPDSVAGQTVKQYLVIMTGKNTSAGASIAGAGSYDPSVSGDSVEILMEDEGLTDFMGVGRLLIPLYLYPYFSLCLLPILLETFFRRRQT